MTGETESQPEESRERGETGEGTEEREVQNLTDATLDPGALIEQSGDIRQAETIQETFTAAVEKAGDITVIPLPIPDGAFMPPLVTNYSIKPQPEDGIIHGGQSTIRGDLDQVTVRGTDSPGGEEATPINLPGPELISLIGDDGTLRAVIASEGESLTGSLPGMRGDLDQVTVVGTDSAGGEEATPIPLPGVRGSASEATASEGRDAETSSEVQEVPVEMEKDPPPPPPDQARMESDTGGGSEGEGAGVRSAIPLEGEETTATTETTETGTESTEQPGQAPLESEAGTGAETGMETAAVAPDENVEGEVNEEGLSEAEEGWNPPNVYMYHGPDGKIVVVGADGKPIDCPPIVASADGASFFAYYPGMVDESGDPIKFDIKDYTGSLTDLFLYHDSTGKPIVVDKNGNPVDSPPSLTSPDGATFYAYYGKAGISESVQLQAYKSSLTDLYLYQDSSGNMIVVDADGNPVSSPPSLTSPDGATFYAYYGKAGISEQVQLQDYKSSLTDLYLYQDSSGKTIVVDADGNPVSSPPSVTSPDGATFYAYYGKPGTSEQVQLQAYKSSLTDLYLYQDSSGKTIVVDADGNPVASPPKVSSADGSTFYASYDSTGTGESVQLQAYKGSLTDVYLYQDSSGKMIVVDATGKPLTSQPTITSPTGVTFYASYAGGYKTGDMVQLTYYKPPSSPPKNPAPS